MRVVIIISILIGGIVYYANAQNNIHKNWYSKNDGVNYILQYAIYDCTYNGDPSSTTIVNVINHIYKGTKLNNAKDIKIAKCTKKVMIKYDPLIIWNAVLNKNTKITDSFFEDIKNIRNNM